MSTTGHESEVVQVQGLKASLKKGGNKGIFNEAICSTAGATAAKVTNTTPPSFTLTSGATIIVKFTYAISVASATLKVGDADAKPIYYRGAALEANKIKAGDKVMLRYNGTQFDIVGSLGETYSVMGASGTNHASGLVPDTPSEEGTSKYLREDGTWVTPPNTEYEFNTAYDASTNKAATMSDLTKSNVGLGNVTNDAQVKASEKGAANGVAELDANGKVPSSQLPSYVDDVIEGYLYNGKFYKESTHTTEISGESGKIYTDLSTDTTYRWSGTQFTQIKGDLAIGTTTGTAADGGIVNTHVNDTDIHVTLQEKSNWGGKQDALVFNTAYDATTNKAATMADVPSSLPANGGNSSTVNNHTVNSDVPANAVFTDTTYSVMGASGSSHASGLVPDPGATAGTSKYLREDGTWAEPTDSNTTYKINLNGTDQGGGSTSLGTIYGATSAGSIGQYLKSSGSGAPTWANMPTSLPASDVYSWAKASTKPSYSYSEISGTPSSLPASDVYSWAKASSKPSYTLSEVGATMSVSAITANTSSSCSITGSDNAGKTETIIYTNSSGADLTVTVPTTYTTPDGAAIELTCPNGGYCEVSYINIGGTIYARGL